MPIYEYKCEACGEVKEEHFSISKFEEAKKTTFKCVSCRTGVMRMGISKTSFQFKCFGFHKTDYKLGQK